MYRNEIKFIIDKYAALLIIGRISGICNKDSFSDDNNQYHIRSLYYDTVSDDFLFETLSGVDIRHKYRIRTYNNDSSFIRLEKKSTENGKKKKDSSILTRQQCDALICGEFFCESSDTQSVLHEFQGEHLDKCFVPRVIVDYLRIPFVYPAGNVRITFDFDVSAGNDFRSFFDEKLLLYPVLPSDMCVLEVKYDDILPTPIRNAVFEDGKLNQSAFSKYALSREEMKKYEF